MADGGIDVTEAEHVEELVARAEAAEKEAARYRAALESVEEMAVNLNTTFRGKDVPVQLASGSLQVLMGMVRQALEATHG